LQDLKDIGLQLGLLAFLVYSQVEPVDDEFELLLVEGDLQEALDIILGVGIFVFAIDVGHYLFAALEGDFVEVVPGVVLGLGVQISQLLHY